MKVAVLIAFLSVIISCHAVGLGKYCVPTSGSSSFCGSLVPSKVCQAVMMPTFDVTNVLTQSLYDAAASAPANVTCPADPSAAPQVTKSSFCLVGQSCSQDADCKLWCYSSCTRCQTTSYCDIYVNATVAKKGDDNCYYSSASYLKAGFFVVASLVALLF